MFKQDIAQTILNGFNRHYALFRAQSAKAKARFEAADWHGQQRAQRERIEFYDLRVQEALAQVQSCIAHETGATQAAMGAEPSQHEPPPPHSYWREVKLHYINLLVDHHQPELAETFFNSLTCRLLHHTYFHNAYIFVRPAVSTEYIENDEAQQQPTYRAYYPAAPEHLDDLLDTALDTPDIAALQRVLQNALSDFGLQLPFAHLEHGCSQAAQQLYAQLFAGGSPLAHTTLDPHTASTHTATDKLYPNYQVQLLATLFYRNKGAYAVGKIVNGYTTLPFALPLLHNAQGQLQIDTVLFGEEDFLTLFSFARAYFLVDMEVPSAYVNFLAAIMPHKPRAEIYNALGLQKQGKALFFRDFLYHLRHSSDTFRTAPGIKGMVMLVFDLPSFPFVFKVIKDHYPAPKETSREQIKAKYLLVKQHDRAGRMADTLEYRDVAFPRARFDAALLAEIAVHAPSQLELLEDEVVVKHLYIERRMTPLNLYLQEQLDLLAQPARTEDKTQTATQAEAQKRLERVVAEYGRAIKDLVRANIFPGDMLWKNFGVTRQGKVVFYDYDEIEYITDCNFRSVPTPRTEEEELSGEIWYHVAKNDVFPETFVPFLLGNPVVRAAFLKDHADLLTPAYWQQQKTRLAAGYVHNIFPYDISRRF